MEVAVARVAGLGGEQALDHRQGAGGVVVPVQQHRVVEQRGGEVRRELEAALEQLEGVVVAAEARRDFGEHADRRHVGRAPSSGAP